MGRIKPGRAERFQPPRRLPQLIERPALAERLRAGLDGQLVVLRAPAGFGKTEAMASLFGALVRQGETVAWLTLSPAEDKPAVLADAVSLAFGFRDGIGEEADPVDRLLDWLAAIPAHRLVLFLDEAQSRHADALAPVLERVPDKLRLVIACRGGTGLALSRLRMRGLVCEVGPADLAFSRAETARILVGAAPDELDLLWETTLGWPALVRAAARLGDLAEGEDRRALCLGTHREMRSFLREEVIAPLSEADRHLLLASAIPEEVPPVLALQLAGQPEVSAAERFEALDPLAAPAADRPGWFRLHPALRAVLSLAIPADEARRLHSRAATWFAAAGQIEKAVHHAGEAGDFGFAAETIQAAGGVDLFLRAGYAVLKRLLQGLPTGVVEASPGLRLCAALVLAKEGQILAARETLDELKALSLETDYAEIPEHVIVHIDCLFEVYEDRHLGDERIEWLEERVRSYRLKDTWERGWLHNHLCIAHTRQGRLRMARLHALKALECYREEGTAYAQTFMLVHLALVNLLGGRLSAAATFSRQAEELIQKTQPADANILAIARIPMAETLYRQGHMRAAAALLVEALPVVSRGEGWVDVFARGFSTLARCQRRLEGTKAALAIADRAGDVAEDRGLVRLALVAEILRVETLTDAGHFAAAREAAARLPDPDDTQAWPVRRENREARIALARLMLRRGEAAEARRALHDFAAGILPDDDALALVTAEILAAEAAHACGDPEAALERLLSALASAQPQDVLEPFLGEGEPFKDMVRLLVRRFGLSAFESGAAAFMNRIVAIGPDGTASPRAGTLSPREGDVLTLLAAGRSNKEIARELGVTEATAKFHLKNVFAKLGASRRTMAVSIARATGLVGSPPERTH